MDFVYVLSFGTYLLFLEYLLLQRKRMFAFRMKCLDLRAITVEAPLSAPGCL
jgi:hypothetical protein